jgi:hypothetical protein
LALTRRRRLEARSGWATLWSLEVSQAATGSTAPQSTALTPINVAANAQIPAGNWTPLVRMRAPSDLVLQNQLDLVNGYADLRGDRAREILAQMTPQYAFLGVRRPALSGTSQSDARVDRFGAAFG